MKDYCQLAIDTCNKLGAEFSDIRIIKINKEDLGVKLGVLSDIKNFESLGMGIRTIKNGAWGFAACTGVNDKLVVETAKRSVEIAEASSNKIKQKVKLAPENPHIDRWCSPYMIDPFKVPIEQKLDMLFKLDKILRDDNSIVDTFATMSFAKEFQWYANSEGSYIVQELLRSGAGIEASSSNGHEVQKRSFPCSFGGQYVQGGFEVITSLGLLENAEKTRKEAVELLDAKPCPSGEKELIILGSQLALQIHESTGHATELDRVLGLEANYAGRSFVTLEKKGNFKYGSSHMNLVADATCPTGLGTYGYDDDGVRAQRFDVVREGTFLNYLGNREFAHTVSENRSNGCNRADGWGNIPIVRMPNLSLLPGDSKLDELIADTKDGIMVDGVKCWSIDQYRYNFQFGMEIGWEIKNGKITGMIKDPNYQGITPDFWGSLNAVCNEDHWTLWGVPNCGKGQPGQRAEMSHGAAPSRFGKVMVGVK